MRHFILSFFAFALFSCSDNAFTSIDTTATAAREYSTNAQNTSGDPDEAVAGYLGQWNGALTSIDPQAPQNIRIMDSAIDHAILLEFGNGVIHTAFIQDDEAVLPLTGTSWRNAVEECPPTADLFVTLRLKLIDHEDVLNISNKLKTSAEIHTDTFILKSK